MAKSHHQDETHMEISQDVLHLYKGQCAINELIEKLCSTMGNLDMQKELSATMQALLYDPTLMTEEGAERPPVGLHKCLLLAIHKRMKGRSTCTRIPLINTS